MSNLGVLFFIGLILLSAYWCSQIMGRKGQSKTLGFFMGFLLFFGVMAALMYPTNERGQLSANVKKENEFEQEKHIPIDSIDSKGLFRFMSKRQIDPYQEYFLKIYEELDLEEKGIGYQWTDEEIELIIGIAERAAKEHSLWFLYIMVFLETYLDADRMIRQRCKASWINTVTGFNDLSAYGHTFFPPPDRIAIDVKKRFYP